MGKDFRDFIVRGNVVDLAVAVIIGAAFAALINSMVDDIIMPPIGLALGHVDFLNLFVVLKQGAKAAGPYASLAEAKAAGAVTLNYGLFITKIVTFLIVAWVVFMLVRMIVKLKRQPAPAAPATKQCPYCLSVIPLQATKCAHCTSDLR